MGVVILFRRVCDMDLGQIVCANYSFNLFDHDCQMTSVDISEQLHYKSDKTYIKIHFNDCAVQYGKNTSH